MKRKKRESSNRAAARSRAARRPATRKAASAGRAAPRAPLFRAFLAMSLDGYIADQNGGVEWLNPYFSPEIDFAGFWKTIGATVMGRATYDWTVAHQYALEGEGLCIVQTHRPIENPAPNVEAFDGDVRELAVRLRNALMGTDKDICLFGGGQSIAAFHEHGLVDRWELAIIPVLLGDGIPLFPRRGRGADHLRLLGSQALKNGIIEVRYEPAGRVPEAAGSCG